MERRAAYPKAVLELPSRTSQKNHSRHFRFLVRDSRGKPVTQILDKFPEVADLPWRRPGARHEASSDAFGAPSEGSRSGTREIGFVIARRRHVGGFAAKFQSAVRRPSRAACSPQRPSGPAVAHENAATRAIRRQCAASSEKSDHIVSRRSGPQGDGVAAPAIDGRESEVSTTFGRPQPLGRHAQRARVYSIAARV